MAFRKFTGSTLPPVLRRQLRLLAEGEPSTNDPKATPGRHPRSLRLEEGGITAQGASAEQRLLRLEAWAEVGTVPRVLEEPVY